MRKEASCYPGHNDDFRRGRCLPGSAKPSPLKDIVMNDSEVSQLTDTHTLSRLWQNNSSTYMILAPSSVGSEGFVTKILSCSSSSFMIDIKIACVYGVCVMIRRYITV